MFTHTARLPYTDALPLYRQLKNGGASCLFESASAADKSSRMSLIGLEPSLELIGKDDRLSIRLLHARAQAFFDCIKTAFAGFVAHEASGRLELIIPRIPFHGPEEDRLERQNIAQPLRRLLAAFQHKEKNFMGLYGALSYRFVYLFEDIGSEKPCPEPDFHLFLFDNILLFNHLTKDLTLYVTRESEQKAEKAIQQILPSIVPLPAPASSPALHVSYPAADNGATTELQTSSRGLGIKLQTSNSKLQTSNFKLQTSNSKLQTSNFKLQTSNSKLKIGPFQVTPDDETFKRQVEQGIRLCNEGELLEIVLSRRLTATVQGDLLPLYEHYKAINPSPYLFYFDFADEVLLGASPEMMLRYENGRATLRPISGSVRRSDNPIEDHHLMMELLNSPKENSELDMLIDLGRNDLARICKPGIEIDQYRIIEKYSHVTHTVAQLSGELEDRYSGFDALIASLNAGTLTGAPKIAAMEYIEQIEQHTRGYYGGCIGWLLFDGDVNTAITIRTAHARDGLLSFSAGATLLYESVPESELKETKIKSGAFLSAVQKIMADE